jgi:uncharacterized phage-like protein YoqJ
MIENPLTLVNTLVKITKYRGEVKDRTARVVAVRDTHTHPLTWRGYKKYKVERSRYLIIIYDVNKGEHRSYYHRFVELSPVNTRSFWRNFWPFGG